jgi:tricorn protease
LRNRSAIVGIAIAILAVALWRFVQPAPASEFRLKQLTFDTGFTGSPAISPDGRMLAYASDRDSSNLSLYVQPVHGGAPVRLSGGVNCSEPSFSPDGATLAYTSTPIAGGTSTGTGSAISTRTLAGGDPHHIADGHTARYSPDGRWISYVDGAGAYIVASAGGESRPFHAEFQPMLAPSWSPDG